MESETFLEAAAGTQPADRSQPAGVENLSFSHTNLWSFQSIVLLRVRNLAHLKHRRWNADDP